MLCVCLYLVISAWASYFDAAVGKTHSVDKQIIKYFQIVSDLILEFLSPSLSPKAVEDLILDIHSSKLFSTNINPQASGGFDIGITFS